MSYRDRQERAWLRQLAVERILDDRRKWQDAHNRRTCQAIWNLPTRQPDRKETGQ